VVSATRHDDVALIEVDNPPVNALRWDVGEALVEAIAAAEADPAIGAIVLKGAGTTFVAGADIAMLEEAAWGNLSAACDFHDVLARIEDCAKPVVVAIHGAALGGGLELAMAGHFRVATPEAALGQPEVNLGIVPGAEGTQRLPRLVGVAKALEMCVTGKPVAARDALEAGLVDGVIEGDLVAEAIAFARETMAANLAIRRTRERSDKLGPAADNAQLFANARALAGRVRRGQIAPLKAVDAIEAAATLPFDEGCRRERELFFECVATEQAKALIHLFFAERAVSRVPGIPKEIASGRVRTVAVVGAGTMGSGIAIAAADAGLAVILKESRQDALDAGIASIQRSYESSIARGRVTAQAVADRLGRIRPTLAYDGFAEADVIIEAVFEGLELKKRIFAELDAVARPSALLATNTSTLDIDEIAAATSRPHDVLGLHFFSPAPVMRLLEIVEGRATSPEVLGRALAFGRQLRKIPVVVANCRGFVGNRMMFPYMYEAQFLVEEGATPEQVDRALTGFGMAMGIFAVDDMAGIDVAWRVRQELGHFSRTGRRRPLVADRLHALGRFGRKTGRGWYRYDEAGKAMPDPSVVELIHTTAAEAGIPRREFTDRDIVERCIYALVNEGARVVEDGAARRASDIDVIYANGYGFPAWRGGPMFYADRTGLAAIHERIVAFQREHGDRWTPAPLLSRLAAEGTTFRERDRANRE
jgi:3-hydroxyacyl-CoA dehydrogenase